MLAAMEQADVSGRGAAALSGLVASQEIDQSVAEHDAAQATRAAERDAIQRAWFAGHLPTSTLGPP